MKKDKFITVFAVFDDKTQSILNDYQRKVFNLGYVGTQTMGIPFHLTLGSFPVECEHELVSRIKETCQTNFEFDIKLDKVNHFNNSVLFIEPEINEDLLKLHNIFDNNYANGFPWHPHATIFCGIEEEVKTAKELLEANFECLNARIVGIQMGEFFPTRMIISSSLQKYL